MNYYIVILSSDQNYDKMADEVLRMFGTLHVFLRNSTKTIEIQNHEINQSVYDKLMKMLNDFDITAIMFKANPDQLEVMCSAEVESIPTLAL